MGARSFYRPEEGRSILLLEEPSVVEIETRVSAAAVKKGIWPVRTDYTGGGFVNQEASAIIQFAGNCQRSDEVTIKHWGPAHHDVLCCWEIATVNQSGQVGLQRRRTTS